jgi:hypothetical protein
MRLPQSRRPILLLDLMALVAAVALTLISPAIMRTIIGAESLRSWDRRQYVEHLGSLILLWWTAMLLMLVFAISRSKFRRTYREPGHAAVLAVGAACLLLFAKQAVSALAMATVAEWSSSKYFWVFSILELAPDASGASVVAVWLILAITGAGRRSSDWFDRLCCSAGLIWISWALTHQLVWHLPITWLKHSGLR